MGDKRYTILAKGLWCRSEMDWDQSSDSDEYYAIVNVLGCTSDGKWKSNTVKVPKGGALEDVDDDEFRKFEVIVWDGPMARFAITTQLMEEDQGDSTELADIIETAAGAAIKAGAGSQGVNVPDELVDNIAEAFPKIFGLGDDRVDVASSRYFSTKRLPKLVASKAQKTRGCRYRFRTWHSGGGASVVLYYDIIES